MSYKISDIPTTNASPQRDRKIELENPTGPQSEQGTVGGLMDANVPKASYTFNHANLGGI